MGSYFPFLVLPGFPSPHRQWRQAPCRSIPAVAGSDSPLTYYPTITLLLPSYPLSSPVTLLLPHHYSALTLPTLSRPLLLCSYPTITLLLPSLPSLVPCYSALALPTLSRPLLLCSLVPITLLLPSLPSLVPCTPAPPPSTLLRRRTTGAR